MTVQQIHDRLNELIAAHLGEARVYFCLNDLDGHIHLPLRDVKVRTGKLAEHAGDGEVILEIV